MKYNRSQVVVVVGLALVGACTKKPASPPTPPPVSQARTCLSQADCDNGWVCLAGHCADTRARALVKRPEEAVTPEKVRLEMERLQKAQQAQVDRQIDNPR